MKKAMRIRGSVLKFAIVGQLVIDVWIAWNTIENMAWQAYVSGAMNEMAKRIDKLLV